MEIPNQQKNSLPSEGLPAEAKEHNGIVVHSSYSAPLPPPALFGKYEEILPGAADRILRMAENQSSHRRSIEKLVIISDVVKSWLGLLFAFCVVLAGMASGVYLALNDKPLAGFVSSLAPLAMVVSAFIYQQKQTHAKEHQETEEE